MATWCSGGDNLVLLVFERAKTGDIIQGLPRIEELLEARRPKEACVLARRPGIANVVYSDDETVEVKVEEADGVVTDYPINPGQNVLVSDGQSISTAEHLTDGPANPHEILEIFFEYYISQGLGIHEAALRSLQHVQSFLVNEVQSVYQSQGIDISDKHIEVIVRQMSSKCRIEDGGDTTMLPGELVEIYQVEQRERSHVNYWRCTSGLYSGTAGYHQGFVEYRQLYLCGELPGNHSRLNGSCYRR